VLQLTLPAKVHKTLIIYVCVLTGLQRFLPVSISPIGWNQFQLVSILTSKWQNNFLLNRRAALVYLINTLLGRNNKPNNLSELSVNDNLVSDLKSMAEDLNDHFVDIGPTLAAEYEEESCRSND